MKPVDFTYRRPSSEEDAISLLRAYGGDAKLLSGGQSLGPMLNMRLARPGVVIDLNDLIELDYVREGKDHVEIGALTRHHRLATAPEIRRTLPLLAQAAGTIGHYAIRQRGTIGGSLVHADPAAQLPLVAVVLEAEIVLRSTTGRRVVRAADFLRDVMTVDLRDDEMVSAIRIPKTASARPGFGFALFSRRRGDFAIVSAATWLRLDPDGSVAEIRLGVGGVGPVPVRPRELEAGAIGAVPGVGWVRDQSAEVARHLDPEDDPRLSAAYRRDLATTLLERALADAVARAGDRDG